MNVIVSCIGLSTTAISFTSYSKWKRFLGHAVLVTGQIVSSNRDNTDGVVPFKLTIRFIDRHNRLSEFETVTASEYKIGEDVDVRVDGASPELHSVEDIDRNYQLAIYGGLFLFISVLSWI